MKMSRMITTLDWNMYMDEGSQNDLLYVVYNTCRENIVRYLYEMLCAAFPDDLVLVTLDYIQGRELIDVEVAGKKQTVNISGSSNQAMLIDIFKQLDIRKFM